MKGLSPEVIDWVHIRHKGHPDPKMNPTSYYSCLFKTSDLILHAASGNELDCCREKYTRALERLKKEPLTLENPPILTLDCVTGGMTLVEGNNRLAAFHTLGYEWFPVMVVIVKTPFADPIWEIPDELKGANDYDNARLWRNNEAYAIKAVYGLETK